MKPLLKWVFIAVAIVVVVIVVLAVALPVMFDPNDYREDIEIAVTESTGLEFSIDGDNWSLMSQGDGDSGVETLASLPVGVPYFFHWDAFIDLDGNFPFMNMRVVARISGV